MHIVCGLKSPVYLAMTKVMSNIRGKAVNCIGWLEEEEEEEEGGELLMLQPALALTVRQKNLGNLYIKGLAFTGDFLSSFFRQVGIFDAFFSL